MTILAVLLSLVSFGVLATPHTVSPSSPDISGCRYVYNLNSPTCPNPGAGGGF
jgi:hypothetical protein